MPDDREVDFLPVDADAAAGGDEDVAVVEGVGEVRQAAVGLPRGSIEASGAFHIERLVRAFARGCPPGATATVSPASLTKDFTQELALPMSKKRSPIGGTSNAMPRASSAPVQAWNSRSIKSLVDPHQSWRVPGSHAFLKLRPGLTIATDPAGRMLWCVCCHIRYAGRLVQ